MTDQADNLRQAIANLGRARLSETALAVPVGAAVPVSAPAPAAEVVSALPIKARRGGPARVFTVTSGKGGVGKTNVSINLAIALSDLKYKVAILDADFGLANVEVLFGLIPKYKLLDAIHNEKTISEIVCDGPRGVKFISGGSGVEELVRLDDEQIAALISGLSGLDEEFDVIIIDTGAGLSETVVGMSLAADEVLLVTTPEPTSVTDAYALIKTLVARDRDKTVRLIVNRAESALEAADIMSKLSQVSEKFLDLKLHKLGYILNDPLVVRSVKQQQPFLIGFPQSKISRSVREIALRLMERTAFAPEKGRGLAGFFGGISKFLLYK
ncbi:MAG: MinD/ParA family protein [Clostridiales bacterium]|jgi:flagellar biosynthesis protein FlhG|nr:MinD/ParA family protein [Clostridiales bacterium]